jgi:hypothetical protein
MIRIGSPQFDHVWRWPVLLALLTVFGLLSALLGQHGIWLWLSWVALAALPAVAIRHVARAWRLSRKIHPSEHEGDTRLGRLSR